MRLYRLSPNSLQFPAPTSALHEPNGLLAFGGDLSPERLLIAYQQGIFPWYSPGDVILWWSPDPRAVLFPEEFHVSRSLRRIMQRCPYRITLNHAFGEVMASCAERGQEGTWIGPEVEIAYQRLHLLGQAHSIEVWDGDTLVGGMYGVAQGALFCGESMFSRRDNASKIALLTFCRFFSQQGGKLIDCQVLNSHTASLGARDIPRRDYLALLGQLQPLTLAPHCWQPQTLSVVTLNSEPDSGE
ncbi:MULTISPECIES: leucyl/phenylalanyl-tRNA--protein transferase [Sodalis]|jgi:leucyl/phenylalanyl-tRNA--protein transferase|uniref:Leucyl/phenylalanyl-tRNA--protein transferase n=1 Tax=Sodalis ligni TaxID=2697027 RepID=A0A4R1NAQ9_9GAMM|nr:leucyl/phenylalanyl-tRNA--protein transferase [Sodalis ligni]TCL03827.1 leucyl/phenylalanyl-tRNA--protein transferase [Sodalis ligni]